jgi:hypothetical protein
MKGVLNHSQNRIKEIRRNQPNRQSGETFRIQDTHFKEKPQKFGYAQELNILLEPGGSVAEGKAV